MALFFVAGLSAGTGGSGTGPALWISSIHADTVPSFLVNPTSIDFGALEVSTVFTETVMVSNGSAKALFISSVTVDSGDFSVTPLTAVVDPFGSYAFFITFAPTRAGDQIGNVIFVHNGLTSPDLLPVAGTGLLEVDETTPLPKRFALQGNYPNPFNPTTRIVFDVPIQSVVSLTIYNALGAEVAEILDRTPYGPGTHEITFDGSNLASGIYFYRLRTPEFNAVKKMVLLK